MSAKQMTENDQEKLTRIVENLLQQAKHKGATAAEVAVAMDVGFNVTSRLRDVETVEYNRDKEVMMTVYFGQSQGSASTTDTDEAALANCVDKACSIARYTNDDEYAGLADAALMAKNKIDLDIYYPWEITPQQAIDMAIKCESIGLDQDKRLVNSDGVSVSTVEVLSVYGNSHGFMGQRQGTCHNISCILITKEGDSMQREYNYTMARDARDLQSLDWVAKTAAERTLRCLGAKPVATCRVPVIFEAQMGRRLIGNFLSAINGTSLYRQASFLKDQLGKQVFNQQITIREEPHLSKGLASAAYDREGVATKPRVLVENGILQGYVLDSYEARKLKMQTTANAGGTHNIIVEAGEQDLSDLIKSLDKGLLITSMMGMGVNIVTGDYSQGVSGFWIENGEIQHPVEEVTVADNLSNMFRNIVAIGSDVDKRGGIQTGSILVDKMTIAGK